MPYIIHFLTFLICSVFCRFLLMFITFSPREATSLNVEELFPSRARATCWPTSCIEGQWQMLTYFLHWRSRAKSNVDLMPALKVKARVKCWHTSRTEGQDQSDMLTYFLHWKPRPKWLVNLLPSLKVQQNTDMKKVLNFTDDFQMLQVILVVILIKYFIHFNKNSIKTYELKEIPESWNKKIKSVNGHKGNKLSCSTITINK